MKYLSPEMEIVEFDDMILTELVSNPETNTGSGNTDGGETQAPDPGDW